ncbi:TRAP transporter substrate-binding protein DctP [Enterocloster lavalensis]|uniref:TRAP transporter substrate-binding protein DctP n=1 Tax=Enterocloster lavalensis TaxID=460384 RepID=UPI002A83A18E|nr:TRAP transporter substrate-binding protein DctP [Enterocloster lavalensis]
MKKSIAMLLSLAMAASLTACGGGSKPAETPAPESTTTAAAADTSEEAKTEAAADGAEDPFAALGDFVMTIGHAQPEGNPRYVSMEKFAADVAEKTNGMNTIDKTFIAMGATTTTIPYSDLYMGLKTSVADGQENPWVNVEGMKFYEVQKYFTEVNYQFHPDPFYVNATWWNALPTEYQEIIQACADEMSVYNDQLIDENQNAAKQVVIDAGCEVYEPTEDELKVFQEAVQVVYDQCIEEGMLTAEELKEMQDIVANAK